MAFYNLFLFLAFRERSFLFLVGFIINLLILQLNSFGILTENIVGLQQYDNIIGSLFMISTTLFFILFGREFIKLKQNLPGWDKILILLTNMTIMCGFLKFFFPNSHYPG